LLQPSLEFLLRLLNDVENRHFVGKGGKG
jgi:hypothetical protein